MHHWVYRSRLVFQRGARAQDGRHDQDARGPPRGHREGRSVKPTKVRNLKQEKSAKIIFSPKMLKKHILHGL